MSKSAEIHHISTRTFDIQRTKLQLAMHGIYNNNSTQQTATYLHGEVKMLQFARMKLHNSQLYTQRSLDCDFYPPPGPKLLSFWSSQYCIKLKIKRKILNCYEWIDCLRTCKNFFFHFIFLKQVTSLENGQTCELERCVRSDQDMRRWRSSNLCLRVLALCNESSSQSENRLNHWKFLLV